MVTAKHCCAGIITHPALALSPSSCSTFGVTLLSLQWCSLCPRCTGVVAVVALALLPSLHWHHCPCCAGIVALVALVLLPPLRWCHHRWFLCHHCTGIFTVVAVAPSRLLHWHLCCWSTDVLSDARCLGRGTMWLCWSWG